MSLENHGSDSRVAVAYSAPFREATRNACFNLLTGGPVLGQREKAVVKFFRWPCCRGARTAQETRFQPARQSSQSAIVAFSMAFDALCSQRPRRAARSRFICGMARRLAKCMLAVSQPMQ